MEHERDEFLLAGVTIGVEYRSGVLTDRLRDLYSHGVSTGSSPAGQTAGRIVIDTGKGEPEARPEVPTLELVADQPIWGALRGDVFAISDGRSFGSIDYVSGQAALTLYQTDPAARFVATHRLFPILVGELLRRNGRYCLHGAAMVSPTGRGMLLLGDSETGKSTFVYTAMDLGWRYVADDGVIVEQGNEGFDAYPFYREFTLDPKILREADRDRGSSVEPAMDHPKVRLPIDAGASALRCALESVVVLQRTQGKSRIVDCSAKRTIEEVYRQGPWMALHPDLAQDHLYKMILLTKSLRRAMIFNGSDILQKDRKLEFFGILDRME